MCFFVVVLCSFYSFEIYDHVLYKSMNINAAAAAAAAICDSHACFQPVLIRMRVSTCGGMWYKSVCGIGSS